MEFDPGKQLEAGVAILDPLMTDNGFTFAYEGAGAASGGRSASGSYSRDDRRLDLHYRWGLGVVRYHIGQHALDHADYMKLLGTYPDSQWVRVAMDKTLDGFHRLLHDLQRFCQDFVSGDGTEFVRLAEKSAEDPKMFSGFRALGSATAQPQRGA